MTYEARKKITAAKLRVAILLTSAGEPMTGDESVRTLIGACRRLFFPPMPGEANAAYFDRVCDRVSSSSPVYRGEVVKPFVVNKMERPLWTWPAPSNPRAAMMDDLPHPISMHGVGNGREDTTQFVRGK
jgi:hypothetical protein